MRNKLILVAALCAPTWPAATGAQARDVVGRVEEALTGRPVANAAVMVTAGDIVACTNDRGEYRLRVAAGELRVLAGALDFEPAVATLAASDTVLNFILKRAGPPPVPGTQATLVVEGIPVSAAAEARPGLGGHEPLLVIGGVPVRRIPSGCIEGVPLRYRGGAS